MAVTPAYLRGWAAVAPARPYTWTSPWPSSRTTIVLLEASPVRVRRWVWELRDTVLGQQRSSRASSFGMKRPARPRPGFISRENIGDLSFAIARLTYLYMLLSRRRPLWPAPEPIGVRFAPIRGFPRRTNLGPLISASLCPFLNDS